MRKFLPLILAATLLPIIHAPAVAQDAPEARTIELRIAAASRGYYRPLAATAERIGALEGVDSARMLGAEGDTMLFEVTTTLDDDELTEALGAERLGEGEGFLAVGASTSDRAKRAEARLVLMRIARKILSGPKPGYSNSYSSSSPRRVDLTEFLEEHELDAAMLNGEFYSADDYHMTKSGDDSAPDYQLWAGTDEWEGVYASERVYYYGEGEEAATGDPDPRFVGLEVQRSFWNESYSWADAEGVRISGTAGRRSDTDGDGVLHVQHGADWMVDILKAAVAYRVRNNEESVGDLPSGRCGWGMFQQFNEEDDELYRYWVDEYYAECFRLSWEKRDGNVIATLTAHNEQSPFYLEVEVDSTAVVKTYQTKAEEKEADFDDLREAELGDHVTWIVGPEEGPEVFERRRNQALEVLKQIRTGLPTAMDEHGPDGVAGTLADPEIMKRLGVTFPEEPAFEPGAYEIHVQILGDVELRVGDIRSGGAIWMLVNTDTGDVIRSSR